MSFHTKRSQVLTALVQAMRDVYKNFFEDLGSRHGFTAKSSIEQYIYENRNEVELVLRVRLTW